MIAHLQRASHTAGLLTYLYGPGERGNHTNPRLIAGDGHGTPIEILAQPDVLAYLAHDLDAPVARLGASAPERPVWVCSVRSDPRHPDLIDSQWAEVARRVVAATGIAPAGDPDACRWIAVRNQARQVHVVATLAREDGSLHNAYRDAFHLQAECHRIATELGHLPPAPRPTPRAQETHVPAPYITINTEPSGSVSAKGASDDLSATLLKHAGFQQIGDWYGRRHRLPTTTPQADRAAIATHAAEMLRAARYSVDLDPDLDTSRLTTPATPLGLYTAGAEVLRLTDQIRAAENGADLAQALDHLLHPEHGVLERVREALETAGAQITDLDDEAYALADRFGFAAEFVSAAQSELTEAGTELHRAGDSQLDNVEAQTQSSALPDSRSAALATSPAADKAKASSALGTPSPGVGTAVRPAQVPSPRTR
ncbi:hypothetical protein [Streptomyces europaeiscabiei]|uniref:hypothetical protein n=1 Tax=Streptomyces europaeiscabiei TaxID=146819 RepID=UPI0029A5A182|nr:hypothetical protein [Streptomyces europaeiscabiei]MDX3866867.1 hypothetical protein [Streptomyces europaeiscabiei]MDX3873105.1 hypothetical protein [Streptomyces europaeiscabiei]